MGGCQTTAYLGQAAVGQARLLAAREPLDRVIADTSRPQPLRERLALVRELRAFAQRELAMPGVQALLARTGGDLAAFHVQARRIAALTTAARAAELDALAPQ